jgi:macrodomain Ter protein organizer (MatP/YcbG family)
MKGQRNIPILHDEVKQRHTIVLTPTVWGKLRTMANAKGMSISEIIEEWVRETTG